MSSISFNTNTPGSTSSSSQDSDTQIKSMQEWSTTRTFEKTQKFSIDPQKPIERRIIDSIGGKSNSGRKPALILTPYSPETGSDSLEYCPTEVSSSSSASSSSSSVESTSASTAEGTYLSDVKALHAILLDPDLSVQEITLRLEGLSEMHTYPVSGVEMNAGALVYDHLLQIHVQTKEWLQDVTEEQLDQMGYIRKAFLNEDGFTSTFEERSSAISRAYLEAAILGLQTDNAHYKEYFELLETAQMTEDGNSVYEFLQGNIDIGQFKEGLKKSWF